MSACSGERGPAGAAGPSGDAGPIGDVGAVGVDGTKCTIVEDETTGAKSISCEDGTTVSIADGEPGTSCTIATDAAGTKTITCEDGTVATVTDGAQGLNAGETPGLVVESSASAPANGTNFAVGERIVLTFKLLDASGRPIGLGDLSSANLYMYGPRATLKTKTASALLNASVDRTATPHHYINLLTTTNTNLSVSGNVITYTLEPVTTEQPGTYTAGLWTGVTGYPYDQAFAFVDVQIGTATPEPWITDGCGDCHKGAASGKMYLHHIDPGRTPTGSWSLDLEPVKSCKACHNEDGYAAIRKCANNLPPTRSGSSYVCADGSTPTYMVDPIVRRVHGVHMGKGLLSAFNTNTTNGDFHLYEDVVFPFNVKNCTKCHTDDSWKTKPSREACGACHDNLDFTTGDYTPPKRFPTKNCTTDTNCVGYFTGTNGVCVAGTCQCTSNAQCSTAFSGFPGVCNAGTCELQTHAGGARSDDTMCAVCHAPDSSYAAVSTAHAVTQPAPPHTMSLTLSAPANGTHYVAGEKPLVTIVLKQNNVAIDHTTVTQANGWANAYVFVNGPRERRIPALTTAARAATTNTVDGPWDLTGQANLQLKVGAQSLTIATPTSFANIAAVTPAEVVAWLNADAKFKAVLFASSTGARVTIQARPSTMRQALEIVASPVGTAMGYTAGVYVAIAGSGSYPANPWYRHTDPAQDDPKSACSAASCTYQLDDVATAQPGTYTLFVSARQNGVNTENQVVNFQVGTATEEKLVATNCVDCHGTEKMHGNYPFAKPDICGSCHDYRRQYPDRDPAAALDGWGVSAASGRSNMAFGAAPISRRVHGVHFGHYLDKPREVHASYDYSGVIFPQDIRNCVKCHSETNTWAEKPSRLVCFSCHDSDAAIAHGTLMTVDPTPVDPWNGDEMESCATCHGAGRDLAPSVVHNIWDPYQVPYVRDP
jgi:hypothetical protein